MRGLLLDVMCLRGKACAGAAVEASFPPPPLRPREQVDNGKVFAGGPLLSSSH